LIDRGDEIFAAAPLLSTIELGLDHVSEPVFPDPPRPGFVGPTYDVPALSHLVSRALAHPLARRLGGLSIESATNRYGDEVEHRGNDVLLRLVKENAFPPLRALRIGNSHLGDAAVTALVASGALDELERLALEERIGLEAITALLRATPRLRALDLDVGLWRGDVAKLLPRLPAGLAELRIGAVDDANLALLAASPCAASLERLALHHGGIARAPEPLGAFRRLRALDLHDFSFGSAGYSQTHVDVLHTLARCPMPELRELWLDFGFGGQKAAPAIVDAFGARLEHFQTRFVGTAPTDVLAHVAGDVVVRSGFGRERPLPLATDRAHEPWLDPPVIVLPK
jgi:hypothetical protein